MQLNSLGIFGSGSNNFFIGNSNCYGATLQPNETCFLAVHFNPNDTVPYSAQVRAVINGGPTFEAELSGTGARPIIIASPDPAEFGEATVGSSGVTRSITLTNGGELPVGFFIAVVSGGDAASFHLVEEDCTGRVLEPTQSCSALIRFAPRAPAPGKRP